MKFIVRINYNCMILFIFYYLTLFNISDGVENNMCTGPELNSLGRKPRPPPYEGSWGTDPTKKLDTQ